MGEESLMLETGQVVFALFYRNHKFVQQAVEIVSVEENQVEEERTAVIVFRATGEPVSAETRECYRVSTTMTGLTGEIGDGDRCPVWDICPKGLSFISTRSYTVGEIVPVTLAYDDETFSGRCSVQSIKRLRRGRARYGLFCIEDREHMGNLLEGLKRISMAVQRRYLSRLVRLR